MLFIDAAQEGYYRPGKAQNFLDQEHVDRSSPPSERSRMWSGSPTWRTDEMRANDFNLNISRYVDTTRHEHVISAEEALAQLREAERPRDEAMAKKHKLLAELGYGR